MTIILSVVCGFGIGMLSGLMGIGGGVMLVPLFMFLFDLDIYRAIGTSLAVIAPVTLVGAYSHFLKGNVSLTSVLWVGLGAAVGIFIGGQIIRYIPAVYLRKGFSVLLIVVAVKIFLK